MTIIVRFRPTVCGAARACLRLTTNDPQRPVILIELTGSGVGPAQAALTLEGGAQALEFGPISATAKSRKQKKRPSHTFTIENLGCASLTVTPASILRTGSDVSSRGISNADDRDLFQLSLVNADGTETLIPNEILVTSPVVNHSYTDNRVRVAVPIQVNHSSDLQLAMHIMRDAAARHPRALHDPAPDVLILRFAESGIELELGIWVEDPAQSQGRLRSDLYAEIWRDFRAQGIEIPYPQRDVRLLGTAQTS